MDQRKQSIEDRQLMRRRFLEVIYIASEANTLKFVGMDVVGPELGLDLQQAFSVGSYLSSKGLVVLVGGEGLWRITQAGIDAVEQPKSSSAVSALGATVNNHIFAPNSTIGAIQQGTTHSTQMVNNPQAGASDLAHLVDQIFMHLPHSSIRGNDLIEVESSLETIKAQTKKISPNTVILGEAGKSLRNITEGVIAAGIQPTTLTLLHQLLQLLPGH